MVVSVSYASVRPNLKLPSQCNHFGVGSVNVLTVGTGRPGGFAHRLDAGSEVFVSLIVPLCLPPQLQKPVPVPHHHRPAPVADHHHGVILPAEPPSEQPNAVHP